MSKWIKSDHRNPTLDEAIAMNGWFRVCSATADPHQKPSMRLFEDGEWFAYKHFEDDGWRLLPIGGFTHWLLEDFPPLPG
jgi:hypothetical protein